MDEIFEIPPEWLIREDPREAVYSDFLDGVRSAGDTLKLVDKLHELGILTERANSSWWAGFLREVQAHSARTER